MQNLFPVHHSPHVCNKIWNIPICVTFTCNWLDWTGLGLGLGLVVFGLGLITDFWSRSRSRSRSHTLWSRSWPWSHYVLVSLTSLENYNIFTCDTTEFAKNTIKWSLGIRQWAAKLMSSSSVYPHNILGKRFGENVREEVSGTKRAVYKRKRSTAEGPLQPSPRKKAANTNRMYGLWRAGRPSDATPPRCYLSIV